jgi:hypothetical protein
MKPHISGNGVIVFILLALLSARADDLTNQWREVSCGLQAALEFKDASGGYSTNQPAKVMVIIKNVTDKSICIPEPGLEPPVVFLMRSPSGQNVSLRRESLMGNGSTLLPNVDPNKTMEFSF